jgi:hypothetical protein
VVGLGEDAPALLDVVAVERTTSGLVASSPAISSAPTMPLATASHA